MHEAAVVLVKNLKHLFLLCTIAIAPKENMVGRRYYDD